VLFLEYFSARIFIEDMTTHIFLQLMGKKCEKSAFEGNKSTSLSLAIWRSKSTFEITSWLVICQINAENHWKK
jgi:hypothetical protein